MVNTARAQLRRLPNRAQYDESSIRRILDAGFLAHIGFLVDSQPFVIPTLYGRHENTIFFHGSTASRMLKNLAAGVAICATVTLVDGLVLARSAFNHSMNYRSVVMFGTARPVEDSEKLLGLEVISEHLLAGRWSDVRPPSIKELKATAVLRMTIEDASAKAREGPVQDDEADYSLPHWAGIVPAQHGWKNPVPDSRLSPNVELPRYLRTLIRRKNSIASVPKTQEKGS
jgi:nitroimidazol reductase NimA-like FMN-containing flavoprotein (pyridoxamine 5'-phosphate oxidase superfamily)